MPDKKALLAERLQRIFRETFNDDTIEIFGQMTAKDLAEWDSINHIALVLAIEKEFDVRLNASEVGKLENVGAMIDLLVGKTG
jgi:acyl carrier protein